MPRTPRTNAQREARRLLAKTPRRLGVKKKRPSRAKLIRRQIAVKVNAKERRAQSIALLGSACGKCGFRDVRALQIDHVYGGGASERQRDTAFYNKVIRSVKAMDGRYQLLCANCNWIKRAEEGTIGGAVRAAEVDILNRVWASTATNAPLQMTFTI